MTIKRSVDDEENIKPKEETSLIVELDNKLRRLGLFDGIENGTEGVCMSCAKEHEKITRIDKSG